MKLVRMVFEAQGEAVGEVSCIQGPVSPLIRSDRRDVVAKPVQAFYFPSSGTKIQF